MKHLYIVYIRYMLFNWRKYLKEFIDLFNCNIEYVLLLY